MAESTGTRNVKLRPTQKWSAAKSLLVAQATTGAGTGVGLGGSFTVFALQVSRATTGTGGGSTKLSYRLQGNIDGSTSTWFTIGAATRNISAVAPVLSAVTSTAALAFVRASINNFTTSGGANPDKVAATVKIMPVS